MLAHIRKEELAMKVMKYICVSTALYCLPTIGFAAVITLDEGQIPTSRASVPANTVPGDVLLCQTALNATGTDCISLADRSDLIFINTRNFGGAGPNADLYSDRIPIGEDFSDLTRIDVNAQFPDPLEPTRPLVNTIALLEGSGRVAYTPTAGQAGFFPGNSYVFLSDSEVPEPNTTVLLGSGAALLLLAGIVGLRRRSSPIRS
jgi:hypothetical protein